MRKVNLKKWFACVLGGVTALSFSSCALFSAKLLAEPKEAAAFDYSERKDEGYQFLAAKADDFAAGFASNAYAAYTDDDNFAVAPVSVFMALSLAAECAGGNTRAEILSALGVSYDELKANLSKLYRALNAEHTTSAVFGDKTTGMIKLTNSIWVDKGLSVKEVCADSLAEDYYCYPYQVDFANKNTAANNAMEEFVKKQTKNQLSPDFDFSERTLFALMNTLYLKDVWNVYGDDIAMTSETYAFKELGDETENVRLMKGDYEVGKAYEGEGFTSFYVCTYRGYKIKFILPNEGVTVAQVFTEENIAATNSVQDYNGVDDVNKIRYYTRCLFPEYEAEYDGDVAGVLREKFGISDLFDEEKCDFSALTDSPAYCEGVKHVTELEVNRKGIEGSSVTVIPGAGKAGPDEYEEVYLDFLVDRAFGFVLTDRYDVTLFSGVVGKV